MSTRVLVVDDSVVFRRVISEALARVGGVEVVGSASNGKLALSRVQSLKPDLITLDIEMPEMNGIEVLTALRGARQAPGVVVLSALTPRGGELTMRALELGAFDFLTKPETGSPDDNIGLLASRLADMVRAFERRKGGAAGAAVETPRPRAVAVPAVAANHARRTSAVRTGQPLVLIGVSTGGPAALAKLLPALPPDLEAPVFVVQHMPPVFTQQLAANLAGKSRIQVTEAQDGDVAQAGHAYIAPGGRQMKVVAGPQGEIVLRTNSDPPENNCRPSVDYFFRSVALQFPGRAIAAILTGMGSDGVAGLRLLKRGGCHSIAQDEATCVVFGMPREAIQAGVIDSIEPLEDIARSIIQSVRSKPLS
jgi:two-component system chemotaxis response regulator CheB